MWPWPDAAVVCIRLFTAKSTKSLRFRSNRLASDCPDWGSTTHCIQALQHLNTMDAKHTQTLDPATLSQCPSSNGLRQMG
jgi:hypothetical protein